MAVLVEAISLIIKVNRILEAFPDGWEGFKAIVPNQTLCADNEVARVGFMSPQDIELFVKKLERHGLKYLVNNCACDMAVADQLKGIMCNCDWLEFGRIGLNGGQQIVAACRLTGSRCSELFTPPSWTFDNSLSYSYGFAPSEDIKKGLQYLRHEDEFDIYLNLATGKEVYVGRTGE